jgi:hypothetical protein
VQQRNPGGREYAGRDSDDDAECVRHAERAADNKGVTDE